MQSYNYRRSSRSNHLRNALVLKYYFISLRRGERLTVGNDRMYGILSYDRNGIISLRMYGKTLYFRRANMRGVTGYVASDAMNVAYINKTERGYTLSVYKRNDSMRYDSRRRGERW